MKKSWVLLIAALLCIVVIFSLRYVFNSDKIDVKNQNTDFVLQAEELLSDFESDEIKANNKYLNKIVQVKGNVGEVIQTADEKSIVILKDKNEIFGINCMITDKEFRPENVKEGDFVSIKGVVKGFLDDVILSDCVIIK